MGVVRNGAYNSSNWQAGFTLPTARAWSGPWGEARAAAHCTAEPLTALSHAVTCCHML